MSHPDSSKEYDDPTTTMNPPSPEPKKDPKPSDVPTEGEPMTCEQHTLQPLRENYYKSSGEEGMFGPKYNHLVSYTTLYCVYCGYTKEVISADQRPKEVLVVL